MILFLTDISLYFHAITTNSVKCSKPISIMYYYKYNIKDKFTQVFTYILHAIIIIYSLCLQLTNS